MKLIQTQNLTKYYGKARGILDVDLAVEEGDFFGFIGPNGAGKSTTIRILLGLISATSGRAEIFGKDVVKQKNEILSNIGYMPSEAMFYHGMKVRDVLRLSADLRKKDCSKEAAVLCERLDLDAGRKVDELSLGNRKKVSIVCALQHRPALYILDEPTSGLDPLIQREFYTLLAERNREGATIFLSSHVLSEIQRYCRHAAVIREGKLLAADTVEALSHTGTKRVILRGVAQMPPLDGVRNLETNEEGVTFLYGGEMQALTQLLSKLPLTDLTVTEPDLEEVFLHYYTKEQ